MLRFHFYFYSDNTIVSKKRETEISRINVEPRKIGIQNEIALIILNKNILP